MAPETSTPRTRLDDVEAGLDAIEEALARLDAGEVDEDVRSAVADAADSGSELPGRVDAVDTVEASPASGTEG